MAGKLREISVWDDGTGTGERFFCMTAEPGGSFEEELHSLMDRYRESGGDGGDEFLLRFHVSDPARQSELLSRVVKGRRSYVSIVGQPPANGSRVALEAWHLGGMLGKSKEETEEGTVLVARRKHYRLFLAGRRTAVFLGCGGPGGIPLAGPCGRSAGRNCPGSGSPHLDLLPGH